MNSEVICIGHRGCRVEYDENTILAFTNALENGADFIELDVHNTKDEKLIVIHDRTLERTTNGKGKVLDLPHKKINEFRTIPSGCRVPLLSEVLDLFKNKIRFILELKGEKVRKPLLKMVKKKDLLGEVIFSSRDLGELFLIKSELPGSQICYNITKGRDLTLEMVQKQKAIPKNINIISLDSKLISQDFINLCHKQNIEVYAWNFINYTEPIEKIKQLISMDVDGILFDNCKNIALIKKWISSHF